LGWNPSITLEKGIKRTVLEVYNQFWCLIGFSPYYF
jgi:hypothetical protein